MNPISLSFLANYRDLQHGQSDTNRLPTPEESIKDFDRSVNGTYAQLERETERKRAQQIKNMKEETKPLRDEIRALSDGRITVKDSIFNKETLGDILRTILATKAKGLSNLIPSYATIEDASGEGWNDRTEGLMTTWRSRYFPQAADGLKGSPLQIRIRQANNAQRLKELQEESVDSGWWPSTGEQATSSIPAHEIGHAVQNNAAKKTLSPDLTGDYAEQLRRRQFRDTHTSLQDIFDVAANNLGYEYADDAASDVSGYAFENAMDEFTGAHDRPQSWSVEWRLPEVFAEAYTDVVNNGERAQPYSKELMRLYDQYLADYTSTFEGPRDVRSLVGILPPLRDEDSFIEKLRRFNMLPSGL